MKRLTRLALLFLPLGCSGCGAVGGLTGMVTGLVQTALYLAAMVAPFAFAYYMYRRDN